MSAWSGNWTSYSVEGRDTDAPDLGSVMSAATISLPGASVNPLSFSSSPVVIYSAPYRHASLGYEP
jgi:hypothetical protein